MRIGVIKIYMSIFALKTENDNKQRSIFWSEMLMPSCHTAEPQIPCNVTFRIVVTVFR
jgi:hypothetical protein